ncbi:MAG: hypothetical protein QXT86_11090 [Archaeoglobaceae archaeon]
MKDILENTRDICEISESVKACSISPVLRENGMITLSEEFIPEKPLYRDKHILELGRMIKELLELKITGTIFLEGPPGTGKTMCFRIAKSILESLISSGKLHGRIVYVKGREKTVGQIMYEILREIGAPVYKKISFGEAISILEDFSSEGPIHICVDEVDLVRSYVSGRYRSPTVEDILYYFSRTKNISATIITNDFRFIEKLTDGRVRSSITKDRTILFEKYSFEQLENIIRYRVSLAFREGAVTEKAIEKLSKIVYETTGDIRQALEILRYAAILCAKDNIKIVDEDLINSANVLRNTEEMINKIMTLSNTHRAILASYYLRFRETDKKELTASEMYSSYVTLADEAGFEALDLNSFRTKIMDLVTVGLLELVRVGKGRGKGVDRLYILTTPFETLHRAVMDDPVFSAGVKSILNRIMEGRKRNMFSIQ